MKKLILTFAFIVSVFHLAAQVSQQTCHFGITFEISNNPNWGYGEPVVLTVDPNSPAEAAGIHPGDIIMEINGTATYLRDYRTIASWLFDDTSEMASFTIRNLSSYFREYELPRRCRSIKSLDESMLASSFSFYSLEDCQDRSFTLPLSIITNKDVDYSDYHTFDFIIDPNAPEIDRQINADIEKILKKRGLVRSYDEPDLLIQTYYTYRPNPKFQSSSANEEKGSWRFNSETKKMVFLPFLEGNNPEAEKQGEYALEFGIRFFDKKIANPGEMTQIWEANTKEFLTSTYTLDEYAEIHLPLIFMQFPYSKDRVYSKYAVSFKRYNYTGLCFDLDDMKTITDVDRNSPAYNAGLRPGMEIKKINDQKFNYTKDEILSGYKRFISETMKYRNPATKFIDANGFPDCMYWNTSNYRDVSKAMGKSIYAPAFSYLYNFEKYISDKIEKVLQVETNYNSYKVIPEIKSDISVRAL